MIEIKSVRMRSPADADIIGWSSTFHLRCLSVQRVSYAFVVIRHYRYRPG